MEKTHGTDLALFLGYCENFIRLLADILPSDTAELDAMAKYRQRLESFKVKHEGEAPKRDFHDHLEETLYAREFYGDTPSYHREIVKLFQIPSVSRLYQLGELEAKPTLAHPSAIFNHAVGMIREDITKIAVDIMVSSTDISFAGAGTLDRTVYKKGGAELRAQVEQFKPSKVGDVLRTPGYLLPVKHILHVIPPDIYTKDTKNVLQKIYREILHTAVLLRATSIAIPCIGTGMLNYPRRDSTSLALEEVKRFLESTEPTSLLEKIIFVTYSSNDEFIYKSLVPVYFPPVPFKPDPIETMSSPAAQSESQPVELVGDAPSPDSSPSRRRTLFGSLGEAFRSVTFGKQPQVSRQITPYEEYALIEFESHAKDCPTCKDINRLYLEGLDLCEKGYPLAQVVLWYMDMAPDQTIYTKPDHAGQRVRLEVPTDLFPLSLTLLSHVDQSFRDQGRTRPFVSQNRSYKMVAQDQAQEEEQSGVAKDKTGATFPTPIQIPAGREKIRAEVATYSSQEERWDPITHGECSIHIYPGRVDICADDYPTADQIPLLSLELTHVSKAKRHATDTEILLSNAPRRESVLNLTGDILLRNQNTVGSEALLEMLQRAIPTSPSGSRVAKFDEGTSERDSYLEWNRRLLNIRDEMASAEHSQRQPDMAQDETRDLAKATAESLSTSASRNLESRVLTMPSPPSHDPSRPITSVSTDQDYSPLAAEVYAHLVADLKTRPGSYIGKHIDEIYSALQKPIPEVSAAIKELATLRKIHNTTDENTWVISYSPSNLPPLEQQKPSDTFASSAIDKTEQTTSVLTGQVLAYMKFGSLTPERQSGHTVREIASALQRPTQDIWPAIRELSARGDITRSQNTEKWVVTDTGRESTSELQKFASGNEASRIQQRNPDAAVAEVRETPIFQDTPPSPVDQFDQSPSKFTSSSDATTKPSADISTVQAADFLSDPAASGARWTRIDKKLVDPQVLTEVGETFEEKGDSLIVHRVLRRGEIERWAEKTKELRDMRARRASRRMSDHRRSEDRDRGRREGGAKDTEQEMLERVLAGDVKEDSRHFGDEDDERKVDDIR